MERKGSGAGANKAGLRYESGRLNDDGNWETMGVDDLYEWNTIGPVKKESIVEILDLRSGEDVSSPQINN